MLNKIDHFAVGTDLLENDMTAMQKALGIELSLGGKHDLMSTHNCVMQAGRQREFLRTHCHRPSRARFGPTTLILTR